MKNRLITTTAAFCLGVFAAGAQAQGSGVQQNRGSSSAGGGSAGAGYQGGRSSIDAEIFRGRGERVIIIFEDDDSDRPEWAGGNTEANPHSGGGGGKPDSAGTMKGDDYGDLITLVRDPVTGLPLYFDPATGEEVASTDPVAELKICLTADCSDFAYSVDGEVPEGVTPIEVDFGRSNIVRSPDAVAAHALDEVLGKLTLAETVTLDEAGRLVLDGATVDSPLENLSLYVALLTGDPALTDALLAKLPADTLSLAASLLAAGADKTGDISVDYVFDINLLSGVTDSDSYYVYDYGDDKYVRSYPTDYSYYYLDADGVTVLSGTLNINDYLDSVNGALPADADGITLFSLAADDALEVIELVHTQIHDEVLPGTITPQASAIAGSGGVFTLPLPFFLDEGW